MPEAEGRQPGKYEIFLHRESYMLKLTLFLIILKDIFMRYLEVIRFVRSPIAVAGHEEGFGSSGSRGTTSDSTLVSGGPIYMNLSGFLLS